MTVSQPRAPLSRWKGKGRAESLDARDEGDGGAGGVVLPLNMVGDGMYEAVYTVTVQVGINNQSMPLQVDTGSSDLWIASTSCSSSTCSQAKGRLYDPSAATSTNQQFSINYLSGAVSGPIYWDQLDIGGYSISNQALAAANTVSSEPLAGDFTGILGLALPLNSIIAEKIPPVDGNSPDGAAFASNLFGVTPVSSAPAARFLSLSLSRPGSNAVPATLGIGRHPEALVSDPSKIQYSTLIGSGEGTLFWQVDVHAITVYVNGEARPLALGRSKTGAVFPSAVVDSGVPYILASSVIANGIYGALGIGPAADGQYYVPCTTPLNITITLDGQTELPLHPLDVTTESQNNPSSSTCVGLIQTDGGQMDSATNGLDDMILGVPFLRNVYMVMAYDVPDAKGAFPTPDPAEMSSDTIRPRLGLLGLTNITEALEEFNAVRVLNQPLSSGGGSSGQSNGGVTNTSSGHKLSVGVDVLLGLVGFFALCVSLFALRWVVVKRRWRLANDPRLEEGDHKPAFTELAQRDSRSSSDGPTEDALRAARFEAYKSRKALGSGYTADTARTMVDPEDPGEFGYRKKEGDKDEGEATFLNLDPWDSSIGWRDTLVGPVDINPTSDGDSPVDLPPRPRTGHQHTQSDFAAPDGTGVAEPLLAHTRDDSRVFDEEFGGLRDSMAGIGTAARGSQIDYEGARHSRIGSTASVPRPVSPGMRVPASPLSAQFPGIPVMEQGPVGEAQSGEASDGHHAPS